MQNRYASFQCIITKQQFAGSQNQVAPRSNEEIRCYIAAVEIPQRLIFANEGERAEVHTAFVSHRSRARSCLIGIANVKWMRGRLHSTRTRPESRAFFVSITFLKCCCRCYSNIIGNQKFGFHGVPSKIWKQISPNFIVVFFTTSFHQIIVINEWTILWYCSTIVPSTSIRFLVEIVVTYLKIVSLIVLFICYQLIQQSRFHQYHSR